MARNILQRWLRASALLLATVATLTPVASMAAPALSTALNEQVMSLAIAGTDGRETLETTVFRPPGPGPFPLLVMNHGKALGDPHAQARDRFLVISREFVRRGYAVAIPMRRGFAGSSGTYREMTCDMAANGLRQAEDVRAALDVLVHEAWVDKTRMLVGGQSYGGLATMAFGTFAYPGVRGLLNFAGGLRIHGSDCDWQSSLAYAFANFGAKARIPSLWFYGANDSHFEPALAQRLAAAYRAGGASAELVAYGAFKTDAHAMSASHDGVKVWWPETERFLQSLGMPTAPSVTLPDDPLPARSDYAVLEDVNAVPYLHEGGREAYRAFLLRSMPRAFAIAPNGTWSWVEDGDDPVAQVLANCRKSAGQACSLYAVNDMVVWRGSVPATSVSVGK